MVKKDHELDIITAYKVTRDDGTDFRTGTVLYKPGVTLEVVDAAPPEAGCCEPGLHLSHTPIATCGYIERSKRRRARFFSGSIGSIGSSSLAFARLRRGRTGMSRSSSASCFFLPRKENKPIERNVW